MTGSQLLPADYVLLGFTLVAAVTGLFRGFSGTLAFFCASAVAALAGAFGWPLSAGFVSETWMRVAIVLVGVLVTFGIARVIVRKLVNGLLAQPADAIFGFVSGALVGAALVVGWAYSGYHPEYSALVQEVAAYVR